QTHRADILSSMKFKCILKIKLFIYDKFIFFMIETSFAWVFLITYMSDFYRYLIF
ncbi:hypothetical protein GZ721_001742, partial [Campylobacter coli]|nr:hypothetical protein [Campylobacter coli]